MSKLIKTLATIAILTIFLAGCGNRGIPVTKNEQNLSGITPKSAAVITEAVTDVYDKPDIMSTRITQVFFNQVVKVISEQSSWMQITLLDGTSGWVKSKYVDKNTDSVTDGSINNRVIVTAKSVDVYSGTSNKVKYKQVVLGTELYSYDKEKTGYDIFLPGGKRGWVDDGGVIAIPIENNTISKTSSDDFIQTISKFKGTIYIIGGTSRWGIDSAGLVYICSRINGVDLPRQLKDMKNSGTAVYISSVKFGDLIFFSTNNQKKDVYDVGVYTGDNQFVHTSSTKGVITDSLDDTYFKERVCAVRRIF